jgi:hypothetical protein
LSAHQYPNLCQWQSLRSIPSDLNWHFRIGYALDQAQLLQEKIQHALQVPVKPCKVRFQHQIITLLTEVEGASRKDLTVKKNEYMDTALAISNADRSKLCANRVVRRLAASA